MTTCRGGMEGGGKVQEGRDICILTADSLCCIAETNTILSEKAMAPTPVLLPGKSHGRRSLVGCSPWGR